MDVFVEYMVKKKKTALDILIIAGTIVLVLLLLVVMLPLSSLLGEFSSILTLLAIALCYGAYRLIGSRNIEFEYAVTNGTLDVDKIMSQRSRKRLISVNCANFDEFGKYKAAEHSQKQYAYRLVACDDEKSPEVWYAVFNDKNKGKTLLVFNASERMLQSIKQALPRVLFAELRKQNL